MDPAPSWSTPRLFGTGTPIDGGGTLSAIWSIRPVAGGAIFRANATDGSAHPNGIHRADAGGVSRLAVSSQATPAGGFLGTVSEPDVVGERAVFASSVYAGSFVEGVFEAR